MNSRSQEFIELYDRYSDAIYRFILFKVSNRETAWDLTQECFMKAWEYWNTREVRLSNPRAFFFTIARNLVIDYWRTRARTRVVSVEAEHIEITFEEGNDAHHQAVLQDEIGRIMEFISALPASDREILTLRYTEDLSFNEIAKITGKSAIALRVHAHRAIKKLKSLLKE